MKEPSSAVHGAELTFRISRWFKSYLNRPLKKKVFALVSTSLRCLISKNDVVEAELNMCT